jgi:hypothetical protein
VRGRDDQVAHRHQVVFIDAVVVDQRAARRFDDADAFVPACAAAAQFAPRKVVVVQQLPDRFSRVQHLDHACPVVGQRRVHQAYRPPCGDEFLALGSASGRRDASRSSARAPAVRPCTSRRAGPSAFDEGKFHVAPGLDLLDDQCCW